MSKDAFEGLTAQAAARQLALDGPNLLPSDESRLKDTLLNAVKEPMFLLLMAASSLYFVLGDLIESLILLFMVCVTVGLTLYQEGKTEKTLQALRDLSSPRALVIRDGKAQRIAGKDLVVGDIMLLSEGDRIAADGVLLSAMNLQVDESLLTGESFPISKFALSDTISAQEPDAASTQVRSGTLVVLGEGTVKITATGIRSEIGKIGSSLQTLKPEQSPLQVQIRRIVKYLAIVGIALSLIVTLIAGSISEKWLESVLIGIALAMSLLPEEFPVILAVFPAIGAWRLSKVNVLTRRLAAIETLGEVAILCTDKTGTLTQNRMSVETVVPYDRPMANLHALSSLPPEVIEMAGLAVLASKFQPVDPMEKAFQQLARECNATPDFSTMSLVREYPLSPELRVMSNVWQQQNGNILVAAKGAPEAVAELCRLSEIQSTSLQATLGQLAEKGLRTLALARAEFHASGLYDSQYDYNFQFMGLVGISDPLRPEITSAIKQCVQAGIRVIMITGDHQKTAEAIAKQAGFEQIITLTGKELEQLSEQDMQLKLRHVNVFARTSPYQKLKIVNALKAEGAVVGMTGDGVNDAPALKAAHVGVAMGGRGTDVAREAASFVLLDDNFASIVHGIKLGRQIFVNMQNAMSYILAIHVPIAGMAFAPIIFGWPQLLYPLHIVFLELIIDPACALAFENQKASTSVMKRPPRDSGSKLIDKKVLSMAMAQGVAVLIVVAVTYSVALSTLTDGKARSMSFIVLVLTNIALIFSCLYKENIFLNFQKQNFIPWIVTGISLLSLIATQSIAGITRAFNFAGLSIFEFSFAIVIGISALILFEGIKAFHNRGT